MDVDVLLVLTVHQRKRANYLYTQGKWLIVYHMLSSSLILLVRILELKSTRRPWLYAATSAGGVSSAVAEIQPRQSFMVLYSVTVML
jgi:hypothetical protein